MLLGTLASSLLVATLEDIGVIRASGETSTASQSFQCCLNGDNVTYVDSFGVEHTPKEIKKFIGNKNTTTYLYRMQAYHSVTLRCFYIKFIDFMLKGKSLSDYNNLFSPKKYEKKDNMILKY